jgi:hypothetical protein
MTKKVNDMRTSFQTVSEQHIHRTLPFWIMIFARLLSFTNTPVYVSYVGGSKSFRSDIQKPRQMENAVRDI